MIEPSAKIVQFCRSVLIRYRLFALMERSAIGLFIGGILSGAALLYLRVHPGPIASWAVAVLVCAGVIVAAIAQWFSTRVSRAAVMLKTDRLLNLEDRLTTSYAILSRGGAVRPIEAALVEDAAERLRGIRAAVVAPFRVTCWHWLAIVGLIALGFGAFLPERSLPGAAALLAERAEIQEAGQRLQENAVAIEQELPHETRTAELAREQADLGRSLRRATGSRAEALEKLGLLEDRIRQRHEELVKTRADEIVSLAERRLKSALIGGSKAVRAKRNANDDPQAEAIADQEAAPADQPRQGNQKTQLASSKIAERADPSNDKSRTPSEPRGTERKSDRPRVDSPAAASVRSPDTKKAESPDNRPQVAASPNQATQNPEPKVIPSPPQSISTVPSTDKSVAVPNIDQRTQVEASEKKADAESNSEEKGLSGFVAEQAAKALPKVSDQLLEKAAELRAGQLSEADLKRLQQAAEALSRDLAQIAQSQEFQKSLEELAKQVKPEQIEAVARQLMSNEKLRQELQATARMLMENRQAREMVAGLAQKVGEMRAANRQMDRQRINEPNGASGIKDQSPAATGEQRRQRDPSAAISSEQQRTSDELSGRGKRTRVTGSLRRGTEGEYLYLQTKPGMGAVRVPYSSAYPRYRREAERSVQRTNVPAHLRSVVRDYFDAINPESSKK